MCQRLGISAGNDFALLKAIGGECAGALVLLDEGRTPKDREARYEELTSKQLLEFATAYSAMPTVDGRRGVRLSLAGAQDKLPVCLEGKKVLLPLGNSPSSHILKFPNRHFKHLPANEVLTTNLAAALELPVVGIAFRKLGREGLCIVERYDRLRADDGKLLRLHQEDLCQALGIPSERKYEHEGGPSLATCLHLVRDHVRQPLADVRHLLRWQIFNALCGNCDGHAKNVSLLRTGVGLRLAPFYDLVCTRAYPRLDRALAMSVGGASNATNLLRRHWAQLAKDAGVAERWMVEQVGAMADALRKVGETARTRFAEQSENSPIIEMALPFVARQTRRVLKQLDA